MSLFTLDHALRSAAPQFRRSDFSTCIMETKVPGLHCDFHDDEEERLPRSNMAPDLLNFGRPRTVDGAIEAHMIAAHLENGERLDSDNAVLRILEEQVSGEEKMLTGGVVSDEISHSQCLEILFNFLMKGLNNKEMVCSVFLDMAEHVTVLPPGNEPLPWDALDMTLWKTSLWELVKEMKIVEEKCPSLMGTSRVYVLTTSPYSAFLRALAAEIADAAEKLIQFDN